MLPGNLPARTSPAQGLAKPVNDFSRGALADDIACTLALAVIQSRRIAISPGAAVPAIARDWPAYMAVGHLGGQNRVVHD